jgi:hypothetical protein
MTQITRHTLLGFPISEDVDTEELTQKDIVFGKYDSRIPAEYRDDKIILSLRQNSSQDQDIVTDN